MSSGYACPYCAVPSPTFAEARTHVAACPRLRALGTDLEFAVRQGTMTINAAEIEQAARPRLVL